MKDYYYKQRKRKSIPVILIVFIALSITMLVFAFLNEQNNKDVIKKISKIQSTTQAKKKKQKNPSTDNEIKNYKKKINSLENEISQYSQKEYSTQKNILKSILDSICKALTYDFRDGSSSTNITNKLKEYLTNESLNEFKKTLNLDESTLYNSKYELKDIWFDNVNKEKPRVIASADFEDTTEENTKYIVADFIYDKVNKKYLINNISIN